MFLRYTKDLKRHRNGYQIQMSKVQLQQMTQMLKVIIYIRLIISSVTSKPVKTLKLKLTEIAIHATEHLT